MLIAHPGPTFRGGGRASARRVAVESCSAIVRWQPARTGTATVAVDAAASGIAGVLFVGASLLICQAALGLPAWSAAIGGALVGAGTGAWLLAVIWAGQRQHHAEMPSMDETPDSKTAAARDSMRLVRMGLVRLHGLPFALMIVIHLAGHVALATATWSILSMLEISSSGVVGLWFETGAKLGNTLGAVVPARLGVFEAGVAASANILDLDPAAGIAVGLVRRLIDMLFVAIGLSLTTLWPITLRGGSAARRRNSAGAQGAIIVPQQDRG